MPWSLVTEGTSTISKKLFHNFGYHLILDKMDTYLGVPGIVLVYICCPHIINSAHFIPKVASIDDILDGHLTVGGHRLL